MRKTFPSLLIYLLTISKGEGDQGTWTELFHRPPPVKRTVFFDLPERCEPAASAVAPARPLRSRHLPEQENN